MAVARRDLQIDRVEELQQQILSAMISDSLDELEYLIAEKGARLRSIIEERALFSSAAGRERLGDVLSRDRELVGQVEQKLDVWRGELRRLRETTRASESYRSTEHSAAEAGRLADIKG